ncbi:MAG: hypothetical protein FJ241_12770 [Nitrospira sp.]|nr:hypothetical protein [Nitrospira sp.]
MSKTESIKSSNVKQDKQAPTDGANFTATAGNAQCELNWSSAIDNGSGLSTTDAYKLVYIKGSTYPDVGCTNGTDLTDVKTQTSYIHTGLENMKQYNYRVCAMDSVSPPNISEGKTAKCFPGCTYSIDPIEQSFPPEGGTGSFTITAPNGCPWEIENPCPSWVIITDPESGSGTGSYTVKYSVLANKDQSQRQCTMTVNEDNTKTHTVKQAGTDIYFYDFEQGIGSWYADNGVWEVGTPTSGPNGCYSGTKCAATVLAGDFPTTTNSRLVSPSIQLPTLSTGQEIHLRFQHWFSYTDYCSNNSIDDGGYVQVSSETSPGVWSSWSKVSNFYCGSSAAWSYPLVDLSAYAGKKVHIGFFHISDDYTPVSSGWYIDDVLIQKVTVGGASMSTFETLFQDIIDIHNNETSSNKAQAFDKAQDGNKVGFCFVATAAYGSYLDPHVQVLREFRDRYLISDFRLQILDLKIEIPNYLGKAFITIYYKISPPIADYIRQHETLRTATRFALIPVVYSIKYPVSLGLILFIGIAIYLRRRKQ